MALLAALLAPLLMAGCQIKQRPKEYQPDLAPAALAPAVARADSTFASLQRRLGGRLMAELDSGGPAAAIPVCRDSAQLLTAEIAEASGIRVGRTSDRLRNPGNVPPSWARRHVSAITPGMKASDFAPVVIDLGDRIGLLRPIPTQELCLKCHGDPASFPPDLATALHEAYPHDQATGYAVDDLRGLMWAEVPKTR